MSEKYVIFHGSAGGFMTEGATYSSDYAQASRLDREVALDLCRARYVEALNEFPIVPIRVEDLKAIKQ